jgi:HAD superfamily hydrolase (TIGR01549 family)
MAWKQGRFMTLLEAAQPIFQPIPALVSDLARETRVALASGSNHEVIAAVLAMRGLRPHFEKVVSAQDVAKGKPAPDIFLHTATLLGVPPADCVVIEDSAAGVAAARAAGMRVIGITNTLPAEKLQDATAVVADYDAIRRLLL